MINNQNIYDNECFKWCLVRYLHPADYHLARITKADKDLARKLDFKDIKFPVKIRNIHKTEKRVLSPLVFLVMKITKNIQYMYKKMLRQKSKKQKRGESQKDKFSKPLKSYLGKNFVYSFINSMIEENKYCSDVMKKHFKKELVMTKEDDEVLRTLLNVGSVIMLMLMVM